MSESKIQNNPLPNERRVSGNIFASECSQNRDGQSYMIRPYSQGWALPTDSLDPCDLRALADEIEHIRTLKSNTKLEEVDND